MKKRIAAAWAAAGVYVGITSEPWMTALRRIINVLTSDMDFS